MLRLRPFVIAIALVIALPAVVTADAPPGPYFNGFETDLDSWFNLGGGTISREADFYSNGGGYADDIDSATGGYHARLHLDPSPYQCAAAGGPYDVYQAPFTRWGGYSSLFPTGGYTTRVDIYLDVDWAEENLDSRFDWSSAINTPSGAHRRDFVFNAGTDALGFVISGGNNTTRCGANPADLGHLPVHVTVSGWYTFEHVFTGVPGGPLQVLLNLRDASSNAILMTWNRSDPSDIVGVNVGGNRYGLFAQNDIDELAIDNSERTGIVSTPGCEIKISDGGWIVAMNGDQGSFGGNAKVSAAGATSGQQQYHDHGPLRPLSFKATTVQAVICSDDRTSAEIYGVGTVDGMGSYEYQISLTDNGEPGTTDKYGILIPGVGYASGDQTLMGGNVQIR